MEGLGRWSGIRACAIDDCRDGADHLLDGACLGVDRQPVSQGWAVPQDVLSRDSVPDWQDDLFTDHLPRRKPFEFVLWPVLREEGAR